MLNMAAKHSEEQAYILDMLVPLTRRQALTRSRRLGYPDPPKYGKDYDLFTCRHWDEATRLCTAYEQRPWMCRDYPYGRTCERACGYEQPKQDSQKDWEWDEAAGGWRPLTSDRFLWDTEKGVLIPIPAVL